MTILLGKKEEELTLVHEYFKPQLLNIPFLEDNDEIIWVKAQPKRLPRPLSAIAVCVFYYSPGQPAAARKAFWEKLQESTDYVQRTHPYFGVVMLGDANELDSKSLARSLNLKTLVDFPTTKGNTSLDVILSNLSEYYQNPSKLAPLGGSYHYMLQWNPLEKVKIKYSVTEVTSRPITDHGLLQFGDWITGENWVAVSSAKDLDSQVEEFHNKVNSKFLECFPERKTKFCSSDKPYVNSKIKQLIKHKLHLIRKGQVNQAKQLANQIKWKIKKAQANYYENEVDHLLESKPSQFFSKVKSLTGKSSQPVDFMKDEPLEKTANDLNAHFASIVQSYPPLPPEDPPVSLTTPSDDNLIADISSAIIIRKLSSLKRTSVAPFDIPVALIKAFAKELSFPLQIIFNNITKTGYFPKKWKKGFITPIPKKGAANDFSGVRPITVTSVFSRIYESFVAAWLKKYLLKVTDRKQFGNIPKCSTVHYLVNLIDFILKHLDEPGKWINLIAIDFRKAFDLFDHKILLEKMAEKIYPALLLKSSRAS